MPVGCQTTFYSSIPVNNPDDNSVHILYLTGGDRGMVSSLAQFRDMELVSLEDMECRIYFHED